MGALRKAVDHHEEHVEPAAEDPEAGERLKPARGIIIGIGIGAGLWAIAIYWLAS